MELHSNHLETILNHYKSKNIQFKIVATYVDSNGVGHFQIEYEEKKRQYRGIGGYFYRISTWIKR